jgi:hypothetical protein
MPRGRGAPSERHAPGGESALDRRDIGTEGVHQVGELGAPQGSGWDGAGVQEVADLGGRGRCPTGLGDPGDDHMGVVGALVRAVGQAAVECRPAGRVQGHRMRALAQADGAVCGVEVVRVRVGAGGPAAEQLPLLVDGDGGAAEPRRASGIVARKASTSWTSVRARSCLSRVPVRKRARSRTMAGAASMALSVRGRVLALRARSRARTCGHGAPVAAPLRALLSPCLPSLSAAPGSKWQPPRQVPDRR